MNPKGTELNKAATYQDVRCGTNIHMTFSLKAEKEEVRTKLP